MLQQNTNINHNNFNCVRIYLVFGCISFLHFIFKDMDCQDFPLRMNFIQRSSLFQVFDIMRLQLWQICATLNLGNIWEAWLGWDGCGKYGDRDSDALL